MEFNVITITLLCVAVLFGMIGLVFLIRFQWLKGFLLGSAGISALGVAFISCAVFIGISSYISSENSDSIATLSFSEIGPQYFEVELSQATGGKLIFDLKGDLWKLDADILNWRGVLDDQDLKPYYQLNKLSSQYKLLSDAENLPSSSVEINTGLTGRILKQLLTSDSIPFFNSANGNTGSLPMTDGALFSISVNKAGLITKPENQKALSSIR